MNESTAVRGQTRRHKVHRRPVITPWLFYSVKQPDGVRNHQL